MYAAYVRHFRVMAALAEKEGTRTSRGAARAYSEWADRLDQGEDPQDLPYLAQVCMSVVEELEV